MLKCLVHCCCCCCCCCYCCCCCCFKLLLLSLFLFIPSSGLKCLVRCSCCRCSHCCYCSCHYCGVVVVVVVVVVIVAIVVAVAGDDGRISFVVVVVLICQLHLTFTRRTVNLQRYSRLGDMHKRNLDPRKETVRDQLRDRIPTGKNSYHECHAISSQAVGQ